MRVARTYPRTVEELVNSSLWIGKIKSAIKRFRISEEPEDILADVICQMLSRKKEDKNYIERWEPGLGSYSNWIYTFVNNICRKKYNREHSDAGTALRFAASIIESSSDDVDSGQVLDRWLPVEESDTELKVQIGQVLEVLSNQSAHSWVIYMADKYEIYDTAGVCKVVEGKVDNDLVGKTFSRDVATTFSLMVRGMAPKDIAEIFQTSTTFVYSLIKKIRDTEAVKEWYASCFIY